MSPERVGGMNYSFNADIWSLGLLVFQCSTGEAPYANVNTFELLDMIVDGNPPTLPQGKFSNEACDFVSLCLKKSQHERPDCELLLMHREFLPLGSLAALQRSYRKKPASS